MSATVYDHEHAAWESYGLADYSTFAEKITEHSQRDLGDCTAGEFYYIPDEPVVSEQGTHRVIYYGDWGNYHSPGSKVHAECFDVNDEGDMEQFEEEKERLAALPEWEETDDEDDEEEEEDDYDDGDDGEFTSGWHDRYMGPD